MIRRRVGRVLLFDTAGRLYLQHGHDPWDAAKGDWWELPGGGVDRGESTAHAAARECWEETGVRPARMGPCVWTHRVQFTFGGWHFDQDEWIHVGWAEGELDYRPAHLEALEAAAFLGARWWPVEELLAAPDLRTLPLRLREFLPDVARWLEDGGFPAAPVDIGFDAEDTRA